MQSAFILKMSHTTSFKPSLNEYCVTFQVASQNGSSTLAGFKKWNSSPRRLKAHDLYCNINKKECLVFFAWRPEEVVFNLDDHIYKLMVFTVTSSDGKVKKARFYEFSFTLGWRLIGNKSLHKFSAPKHVSFRKHSSLNFRVFTVRDTKIGMLSPWKKSLRLIFSSLTISSIRRYVYAQVC